MNYKKTTATVAIVLMLFTFLPGCIGQEEEPETITQTQTATETAVETVTQETTPTHLSPYIFSGKLDGEGIPPDFFSDIDVRKGFAYAFPYDTYIADTFLGEAFQPISPNIRGLPYRNTDQPGYYFDLALAEEHFKKAWNGDVWEIGFKFTLTYNEGNEARRIGAQMIQYNVEQLNENFFIYVRAVTWPTQLQSMIAGTLPMFIIGWLADYPDPHNFVYPFQHSTGTFSGWQNYDNPEVDALIAQGIETVDPVAREEIYYELQRLYVEDIPSFGIYQTIGRHWERDWVEGWYYNPIYPGPYYYDYWKKAGAPNQDTISLATIGEVETLDPAWVYDTASATAIQNMYDTLIFFEHDPEKVIPKTLDPVELTAPTDEFVPRLAVEVPTLENGGISADGLTYTFKIREGVKFWNDDELTPEDVEYTFERGLVQDRAGGPQWMFTEPLLNTHGTVSEGVPFEDIDNAIEVVGDSVVFHLAMPYPPFMTILAQSWAGIVNKDWCIEHGDWPGTAETYEEFNNPDPGSEPLHEIAMGTGPFELEWWEPDEGYSLLRNEDYWRGPAFFKRVIEKNIAEWSTRKLEFLAGDVDFCYVPRQYILEVIDAEGVRCIAELGTLSMGAVFFQFNIA